MQHRCYTLYDPEINDFVAKLFISPEKYDCLVDRIPVVGLKYRGLDEKTWRANGKPLELLDEPENRFDSGAIAVSHEDIHIGYVPKHSQSIIRKYQFSDQHLPVVVSGEEPVLFVITRK